MGKRELNASVGIEVSLLRGEVAPGFEEVASEFERNFAKRGEVGAACAVYHEGRNCGVATGIANRLLPGRKTP